MSIIVDIDHRRRRASLMFSIVYVELYRGEDRWRRGSLMSNIIHVECSG